MVNRCHMLHQAGQGDPHSVPSAPQSQSHQFEQYHGNRARNHSPYFWPYVQNSYIEQHHVHYEPLAARSSIPNHLLPGPTSYGFDTNTSASNFYNGHLMASSSSGNGFFRESNITRTPLETSNWGGLQHPNASSVSHCRYQHPQPQPPPHLQAMRGNEWSRSMPPQLHPQLPHMEAMGGIPPSQDMLSSHMQAMRGNHQPQNMLPPAMRGNNFNHQPQVASSSYGHSVNSHLQRGVALPRGNVNNRTEDPSTAFGLSVNVMYQFALECLGVEDSSQYHMRNTIREEGVAVLEQLALDDVGINLRNLQDGVYIFDSSSDLPHPSMSYEFLLSLADQNGQVKTGLSDKTITENLKTRTCVLSGYQEEEPEICVICQAEYEDSENIGSLHCGHEYHADCIKSWLLEKNICPVCKATAMPRES